MEFRVYITVPNLPVEPDSVWQPLAEALERDHSELGPVIGWHGDDAEVVVSTDADDEAHAAGIATAAVGAALHAAGLGERYPSAIEIEPISTPQAVPA